MLPHGSEARKDIDRGASWHGGAVAWKPSGEMGMSIHRGLSGTSCGGWGGGGGRDTALNIRVRGSGSTAVGKESKCLLPLDQKHISEG